MNLLPLILSKRAGGALDDAQIEAFVAAVCDADAADYQISALLMAIYFRGMDARETVSLTRAMARSGEMLDWSGLDRPSADKHSTGGVGDKLSLVVAPLAASLGLAVPMLSGRGLGFTGGTLDKMESIPGLSTKLTRKAFERQVAQLGCAIIGQSEAIAPADRRLYALRDVTGSIESTPLIVSSILSKKIAAGPRALVVDLKVGQGAFMQDLDAARELGRALLDTAAAFDLRAAVLFTAMDAPLGRAVGNAPEVAEALDLLAGAAAPELRALACALVGEMLRLARPSAQPPATAEIAAALDDGRALETFMRMVRAQGGRLGEARDGWGLPRPAHSEIVRARADGILPRLDAGAVGRTCVELGAGRRLVSDPVDPTAGIVLLGEPGERIRKGDEICRVQGADPRRVEAAAAMLAELLAADPAARSPGDGGLFLGLMDAEGWRPYGPRG